MDNDERRSEPRVALDEPVKLQIVTCRHEELVGKEILGRTKDASGSALRLKLVQPVPVGGQVDLWIEGDGDTRKFFLSGHVLWERDVQDGFELGVMLYEGAATDIDNWRAQYQ
ncbi:MAG: PilZ domain-containing protein [Pseudomonadota bacterium]